jgi:peptidylprolyl isomerase
MNVKPLYVLIAVAVVVGLIGLLYFAFGNGTSTVVPGDTIQVYYTGKLANGTVFGSNVGQQPFQFTVGANQVIYGFDQGVIGMTLNENRTLVVPMNEAYGPVNPALIAHVPVSQFTNPPVEKGSVVNMTNKTSGTVYEGIITAVNATTATVDFNPPLAGQTLIFNVKVVGISK